MKVNVQALPAWIHWFAADVFLGGKLQLNDTSFQFLLRLQAGYSLLYDSVYNRFALSVGAFVENRQFSELFYGGYLGFTTQREGLWVQLAAGTDNAQSLLLRASVGWSIFGLEFDFTQKKSTFDSQLLSVSFVLRAPLGLLFRHLFVPRKFVSYKE